MLTLEERCERLSLYSGEEFREKYLIEIMDVISPERVLHNNYLVEDVISLVQMQNAKEYIGINAVTDVDYTDRGVVWGGYVSPTNIKYTDFYSGTSSLIFRKGGKLCDAITINFRNEKEESLSVTYLLSEIDSLIEAKKLNKKRG